MQHTSYNNSTSNNDTNLYTVHGKHRTHLNMCTLSSCLKSSTELHWWCGGCNDQSVLICITVLCTAHVW